MAHEDIRFVSCLVGVIDARLEGISGRIPGLRRSGPDRGSSRSTRCSRREHVDLTASVVALDDEGEPLGVCLLAIRDTVGWCGGLGVVPAMRRKGLGRELMQRTIEEARARGLERFRLECIDGNEARSPPLPRSRLSGSPDGSTCSMASRPRCPNVTIGVLTSGR